MRDDQLVFSVRAEVLYFAVVVYFCKCVWGTVYFEANPFPICIDFQVESGRGT